MPRTLAEVQDDALALPAPDRAALAQQLIETLDPARSADVEESWIAGSEARYAAYRRGEIEATPADEVLRRALDRLS